MSQRRRELYFRIINEHIPIHVIARRMHFLDEHFPLHQLDEALLWLISHQLVGVNFVKWFKVVCQSSDLEMHRKLLEVVTNSEPMPVIAGKNFRT